MQFHVAEFVGPCGIALIAIGLFAMGLMPGSLILLYFAGLWLLSIAGGVWWHYALKNKQRYRVETHAI